MFPIAGQMAEPNGLTFFEGNQGYAFNAKMN